MWEDKGGGKSMNAFKRIRLKTYAEYEILCTYPFLLLIFKKYDLILLHSSHPLYQLSYTKTRIMLSAIITNKVENW